MSDHDVLVLPTGEHKCVICFLMCTDFGLMGFTKDNSGHVVCRRCRDVMDILEDDPTHCRMCPGYRPACGIAWDVWKQGETFYCFECLIASCLGDQTQIQQLCEVFARDIPKLNDDR